MFGSHVVACTSPPDLIILQCNGQGDGEALGGLGDSSVVIGYFSCCYNENPDIHNLRREGLIGLTV